MMIQNIYIYIYIYVDEEITLQNDKYDDNIN